VQGGLGRREGWPENVIWILKWVGELPPTHKTPCEIAAYRCANGTVPEGSFVDATERFTRRREQVNSSSTAEAQEALF
jgi:hypothetical protein